jgi:hypothetical protein|tara:strand:- start:647 stop:937 length:291 start_codon:yes stop_codon:yes gene_type:complete
MNIQISNKIGEIIKNSNCSTYIITGYRCMETRLVMEFHDCKQVIDFKLTGKSFDDYEITAKFYTKESPNHELRMEEMKAFSTLHEKEQPEFDSVTN